MMEVLRFIKWWWNKGNDTDHFLIFLYAFSFSWIILIILFGSVGFSIGYGLAIGTGVLWFLKRQFRKLQNKWSNFKKDRDCDAQKILDRLGSSLPRD